MTMQMKRTNDISLTMIQSILNYIELELLNIITPVTVARQFYISESTLSSLFKLTCGMTVMEYIRSRRLTLAAQELTSSHIAILDLAYKYGYDTPEAFTKAFTRFHGFPPSLVRRGFPINKIFEPLQIAVIVSGGWKNGEQPATSVSFDRENSASPSNESTLTVDTTRSLYTKEWDVLYSLSKSLLQKNIPFKIDGKTMIFAHGLEFPLDKICLTFKWKDEETVQAFFHTDTIAKCTEEGFKYFDVIYEGMKIRCMFYGDCPGDDTDEFLYRNTDSISIHDLTISVQSLAFYYQNADPNTIHYKMVKEWLETHERL